jgi:hypothetical protein
MGRVDHRVLPRPADAEVESGFVEEDAAGSHLAPEPNPPLDLALREVLRVPEIDVASAVTL